MIDESKRSPLKDRPLRNHGQSLDEQIRDLAYDYLVWPTLFAMFLVIWGGCGMVPLPLPCLFYQMKQVGDHPLH